MVRKHFPATLIEFIPQKDQRYNTCGDYYEKGKRSYIRISQMSDWRYEALVLIHELVEYILVRHYEIPIEKIDEFDRMFEKEREEGIHTNEEPGDDPRAPYREQHKFASQIERMVAVVLRVDWQDYEKTIDSL